ncbi:MAG: Ig-like domain-containing protein [Bacteroidales bacterium]|nr:Ig-like domain-containing protein [Bacteroidales bacterium]
MKKALTVLAVLSLAGLLACVENEQPSDVTILAEDLTLQEGQTVNINATCNSTATITYTSDNPAVATVSPEGEVSGVKAGSAGITLRVDAVEGKFKAAEKTIQVTVTAVEVAPKPQPGVYTFTASKLKGQWKAGDQIYIQCGYGPSAQVITLADNQISDGGKTASAELSGDLFKYLADPDPLYAAWPAEAVKKQEGLSDKIIYYSVSDILLTQAYLVGNNFSFIDVSSIISFTVSGGFDHFLITGAQRPGLRYSSYKNEYSSVKESPSKPKDDGYPFREGQLSADGDLNSICFPGGITFNGGFSIYFAKGDDWTASYTYSDNITLKPGKKLDLGDITASLKPHDGPKPSIPEITDMTRLTVALNELSGICVSADGNSLWAVGDGSQIANIELDGTVINKANIWEDKYTIDSEGLSLNYDTGDFLISGEPNCVYRISSEKIGSIFSYYNEEKKRYEFTGVQSLFNISDAASFGNSGAEGCSYYKDGLVFIGTQTGAYLYLCNLETGEVLWKKGLRSMHTVITEIAGLCYDPLTDWLWVVDSEAHKFFALSSDAEKLHGAYLMNTKSNEESICIDHKNSCVWIGDDYGSTSYIYRYNMKGLDDFNVK